MDATIDAPATPAPPMGTELSEDALILHLNGLPLEELRRRERIPFRILPTVPALLDDFAHLIQVGLR